MKMMGKAVTVLFEYILYFELHLSCDIFVNIGQFLFISIISFYTLCHTSQ